MNLDTEKLNNIYIRQFCMHQDQPRELLQIAVLMPVEQVWFGSDGQLYKSGVRLTTSESRESSKASKRVVYG